LWLALLLPLAQAAANWHTLSHWNTELSSRSGGKAALAEGHCGFCLSAAAVTGGAAASTPLAIAHTPPRRPPPQLRAGPFWSAPVSPAYQSRAPPVHLR
jgi:hypothetical protein